ncbi:MAG: cell division protein FtsZ, partial [Caulobacteraceae bacterium]
AVLVNITGGLDMTLLEVDEAANAISAQVDPEANIIFGAAFDPTLDQTLRVSVVATGMDGVSIAAIEPAPRRQRRAEPHPIEIAPEPEPVLSFEPEPEPEPVMAAFEAEPVLEPEPEFRPEPAYAAQPPQVVVERVRPTAREIEAEARIVAPEPLPAPTIVASPVRTIPRIVDPSVAEDEDAEPLFAENHYGDERGRKGGWLSLFGRPRHEATPVMRQTGAAQPAARALPEETPDEADDLEIPSFLRRLAN